MVSEFLCSTRVNDAADAASCRAAPWYSRHSDFWHPYISECTFTLCGNYKEAAYVAYVIYVIFVAYISYKSEVSRCG